MKPFFRIFLAAAAVLVMAVGAWNAAAAQRNPASGFVPNVGNFVTTLLHRNSPGAETQHAVEASQSADDHSKAQQEPGEDQSAVEDNSQQQANDNSAELSGTPEAGGDNGVQRESTEAPETHGEVTGTLTAMNGTTIIVDGQVFQLAANVEGAANLQVGAVVKVEFVTNPNGTVSVREIKSSDLSGNSGDGNQSGDDSTMKHDSSGGADSGSDGGHHGGGSSGGGDGGGSGSDG